MSTITSSASDTAPKRIEFNTQGEFFCESDSLELLVYSDSDRTALLHTINCAKSWHGGMLVVKPAAMTRDDYYCSLRLTTSAGTQIINRHITWSVS